MFMKIQQVKLCKHRLYIQSKYRERRKVFFIVEDGEKSDYSVCGYGGGGGVVYSS